LIVLHNVPQVVTTGVMRLAHAHGVVREVDITVIAYNQFKVSALALQIALSWWYSISKVGIVISAHGTGQGRNLIAGEFRNKNLQKSRYEVSMDCNIKQG